MKQRKAYLENEIKEEQRLLKTAEDYINYYNKGAALETAVNIYDYEIGFTEDEINYIKTLFIDTDYTISNIFSTSLDDTSTMIDRQLELYEDAMSKLSEVSRPQYQFTVELDNLLRIPEFADWNEDLRLMRFIRLGIRDDYSVKLRIIEIEYNPCEVDENL
jgi:hypothetical protein